MELKNVYTIKERKIVTKKNNMKLDLPLTKGIFLIMLEFERSFSVDVKKIKNKILVLKKF
jgi:hypothetical protein